MAFGLVVLAVVLSWSAPDFLAAAVTHPLVKTGEGCVTRQCHAALLQPGPAGAREASAHQPAADGDCGACHDLALRAGTRYVKGAPAAADAHERGQGWDVALCAGCHGESLAAKDAPAGATGFTDGRKNLHALHVQAARGPRCLPCHDPHASRQAKLLRERIPARGGVLIAQEFRAERNGGWCRTGCHAPKRYFRQ